MKKMVLPVMALIAMGASAAMAADLPAKVYTKAPPLVVSPWDIAFGASITNDYRFRGVAQSNRNPSVSAYFEPRYNINPNLQIYAGLAGSSISFTNRAAAEIDGYVGIRPTFGALALDAGFWYYGYPGGQCIDYNPAIGVCPAGSAILPNGNAMKANVSFYEIYGKATYTFNDMFAVGGNLYYSPNFLNFGTRGVYASATAKITAPSNMLPNGIGAYASGEFGRQWLGRADAFYLNTLLVDYNTWNVGVGFTWKAFTLDLRYSDTNMNKVQCNNFTSDFTAIGGQSNWCGAAFVAKLSVDTSVNALK